MFLILCRKNIWLHGCFNGFRRPALEEAEDLVLIVTLVLLEVAAVLDVDNLALSVLSLTGMPLFKFVQ